MLKISAHGKSVFAQMANNKSAEALIKKLKDGPIKVAMEDYGNMEKVGPLGFILPKTDESITTTYGDIILYQGHNLVIYYDTNQWTFTKLGHIQNVTQTEIKEFLTKGDVEVELSLADN